MESDKVADSELKKASKIVKDIAERNLVATNAQREELGHLQDMLNRVFDKIVDTAKILVSVSAPALVTLYSIKGDYFNKAAGIRGFLVLLFVGIAILVVILIINIALLFPFIRMSWNRLKVITEISKSVLLTSKADALASPLLRDAVDDS